MSLHNSRHGTTCSISSKNTCRRVFFVYRSKPFIVARLLCCLFVDLIWRNLLYIPVERGDLIQSLLSVKIPAAYGEPSVPTGMAPVDQRIANCRLYSAIGRQIS